MPSYHPDESFRSPLSIQIMTILMNGSSITILDFIPTGVKRQHLMFSLESLVMMKERSHFDVTFYSSVCRDESLLLT